MFWKRLSLTKKIFAAIVLTSATIVVVMALLVGASMRAGFSQYLVNAEINRLDQLEEALAKAHDPSRAGWPELTASIHAWRKFVKQNSRPRRRRVPPPGSRADRGPPPGGFSIFGPPPPRRPDPLRVHARISLLNANGVTIAGPSELGARFVRRPVRAAGAPSTAPPLGWIGLSAPNGGTGPVDAVFISGQLRSLLLASVLAVILSMLAALFLARQFLAPIKQLAAGTSALTQGNYASRMTHTRQDELGRLIDHFNVLAESLEAAERAERQWITNTSHELQTPLAVLRAEIEGLQDGVRKPTAKVLSGLHTSVMRLSQLAGDLNTLSRGREGGLLGPVRPVPLNEVIEQAADHARRGITDADLVLETELEEGLVLTCDRFRLRQLLDNLLENARRYTASPGKIVIKAYSEDGAIKISVDDTAPGPPPESFEHLFKRFYRVEQSRAREHGGSGLGLAICKAIVEAHRGTIVATASSLGGLSVVVTMLNEGA